MEQSDSIASAHNHSSSHEGASKSKKIARHSTRRDSTLKVDIDNPLLRLSPSELERNVKTFVEDNGLQHISDLLLRGARVARDPDLFRLVEGLTDEEREALEKEPKSSFWQQTKALKLIILTCSIAAVLQGFNQAAINGANLTWYSEFGLDDKLDSHEKGVRSDQNIWIFGFVNAAPFLFGALVGVWLNDPLNEYVYGRRGAIFIAAFFSFFSAAGSAFTQNWHQLLACRILLGIGVGAKAAVVPVFAAESSPAHIRGSLVMTWQLFVTFGQFLGFSTNLAVSGIGRSAWRTQLGAPCFPAIPLLFLVFVCPESPRFLIKIGKFRESFDSLCALNDTPLQAARELYYIHAQIQAEMDFHSRREVRHESSGFEMVGDEHVDNAGRHHTPHRQLRLSDYWRRFWELFSVPRIRHSTISALVVMIAQQLCGCNVITFYSSTIFSNPQGDLDGLLLPQRAVDIHTQKRALWLTWGFGLTNFIFTWPAHGFIDKWGRRPLLLISLPLLALALLAAGLCFLIDGPAQVGAIAFFIILFAIFYSLGLGPVPFTYSAEVFPLVNRAVGMSLAVFWNFLGAGILDLTVPFINQALHPIGLLCLFAGFNVIAFILVFLFLYESTRASLEEMNDIFAVKIRRHMRYQLYHVLPWAFNYYIKRTETKPLDPPYSWENDRKKQR